MHLVCGRDRSPKAPRPQGGAQSKYHRAKLAPVLMLEEKWMTPLGVGNFVPLKSRPAFRAAALGQAAQVVIAKRAENIAREGSQRSLRRVLRIDGCCIHLARLSRRRWHAPTRIPPTAEVPRAAIGISRLA